MQRTWSRVYRVSVLLSLQKRPVFVRPNIPNQLSNKAQIDRSIAESFLFSMFHRINQSPKLSILNLGFFHSPPAARCVEFITLKLRIQRFAMKSKFNFTVFFLLHFRWFSLIPIYLSFMILVHVLCDVFRKWRCVYSGNGIFGQIWVLRFSKPRNFW